MEGKPESGITVFRISSVDGNGKVIIVYYNLVVPIGTCIDASGNEEDLQDIDGPWVCTQAVMNDVSCGWRCVIDVLCIALVKKTLVDAYMHNYCYCMHLRMSEYLHMCLIIYTVIVHSSRIYT